MGGEAEVDEPRLKIEKQPAELWRDYVGLLSQGKKSAPLKLNKVREKIAEIIETAEVCGYVRMLAKWSSLQGRINAAVEKGEQAAFHFIA